MRCIRGEREGAKTGWDGCFIFYLLILILTHSFEYILFSFFRSFAPFYTFSVWTITIAVNKSIEAE